MYIISFVIKQMSKSIRSKKNNDEPLHLKGVTAFLRARGFYCRVWSFFF